MRRAALLLLGCLLVAGPGSGQEFEVNIASPPEGRPALGEIVLDARIDPPGTPIEAVEFYVDYKLVGRISEPPYRLSYDVGPHNEEHRIEVVAYPVEGEAVTSVRETPAIAIDEQIDVSLRQLYVTVTRRGERVLDLRREHFEVRDGGRRQEIVTFARGDIPFTAVVLIDASGSMAGESLATAIRGARHFAERLRPLDEVKLLVFSDRRLRETDFTNLPSLLTLPTAGVQAGDGTALNDMLFLGLKRVEARQGRRVVLVLSDGADIHSVVPMRVVAETAQRVGSLIYWVQVDPDKAVRRARSIWRSVEERQREFDALGGAVHASGGRVVPITSPDAIGEAFTEILRELREQYVLGYTPDPKPLSGTWRPISVRVHASRGFDVRAPTGYIAP